MRKGFQVHYPTGTYLLKVQWKNHNNEWKLFKVRVFKVNNNDTATTAVSRLSGVLNFEKVYITFGGVSIVTWIKWEQ